MTDLIDLIDLAMVGKQAHRTVEDPRSRALRLELDEMVSNCRDLADGVAQRSVALGAIPDGQVRAIADRAEIPPLPAKSLRDHVVVSALTTSAVGVVSRAREGSRWRSTTS
jgi:starvation-inducible DNA-binding protein